MSESVMLFSFFAAHLCLCAYPNEIALHLIHGLVILEARALEGAAVALMFESLGDGPLCACGNCKYVQTMIIYFFILVVFVNPKLRKSS